MKAVLVLRQGLFWAWSRLVVKPATPLWRGLRRAWSYLSGPRRRTFVQTHTPPVLSSGPQPPVGQAGSRQSSFNASAGSGLPNGSGVTPHSPGGTAGSPRPGIRPAAASATGIDHPKPGGRPSPAATDEDSNPLTEERFRLGKLLGKGGQGSIFELADHPDLVYKSYGKPIAGVIPSLSDLVLAGQELVPKLEQQGIITVWPKRICGKGDTVLGYVMRRIPRRFKIERQTPYGDTRTMDATLDQAISSKSTTFLSDRPVTTEDRIQLARLVGTFLQTLHENDFVYGDLSLRNMMFSLAPVELLVMDLDGVHRISARLNPQKDLLHTPDWKDPLSADQIPLGFDLDRYKFALLVHRLLVADNVSAPLPKDRVPISANIDGELGERLGFLLHRAATGGVGSRPPINEWLAALEDRRAVVAPGQRRWTRLS